MDVDDEEIEEEENNKIEAEEEEIETERERTTTATTKNNRRGISLIDIIVADPVRRPYGTESTNDSDGCTIDTIRYTRMYIVVVVVGVLYIYKK